MNVDKIFGKIGKIDANFVVRIGVIGLCGFIIYRLYKSAKINVDIYTTAANNPTLSNLQIANLATKISSSWGLLNDDETSIYNAFNTLGNYDDLVRLMRSYSYKGENLQQSITKRMSNKEINKINSILASKGINYKF